MYTRIQEATRLTREGRLAEATALIQSSLGLGQPPQTDAAQGAPGKLGFLEAEYRVVEPGQTADKPATAAPAVEATEVEATVTTETEPKARPVPPRPAAGFAKLRGVARLPKRLLKAKLKTGLRPRHVPAEAISPPSGRWIASTHSSAHGNRAYKVYLPSGCDGRPLPLVVMLHGCTQDPDDFAAGTAMNFVAETGRFLVAYPAQAGAANPQRCWNWFQPADQQRDQGEPALIAGITRQVMAEYKVDPDRVYVAGMSAGGAMAAVMAAAYPDFYAAVGVHSGPAPGSAHDLPSAFQAMQQGSEGGTRQLVAPVPLILFHGDQDHTVHPSNAEHLVAEWAAQAVGGHSAAAPPDVSVSQDRSAGGRAYTRAIYQDAGGHAVVERWTVHGAGHAWSGGSRHGSFTDPAGPDASRELARFFLEHPRKDSARVVIG
jgi:poly(hydroxyalkanoate) depolymerase family esterase